MAEQDKNKEKELEKKNERENTIKAENQGGVWISDQPNRNAEKYSGEEADFDKMKGIDDGNEQKEEKEN
jgi:hypothetical protein